MCIKKDELYGLKSSKLCRLDSIAVPLFSNANPNYSDSSKLVYKRSARPSSVRMRTNCICNELKRALASINRMNQEQLPGFKRRRAKITTYQNICCKNHSIQALRTTFFVVEKFMLVATACCLIRCLPEKYLYRTTRV